MSTVLVYRRSRLARCCIFACILQVLFHIDVSCATDIKCELKSSCSPDCKQTKPLTVAPGFNITLNCSVITGVLVQGMTWNQALERVKNGTGQSSLVLERWMSTKSSGKQLCNCTAIKFTRALEMIYHTGSPNVIKHDKPKDVNCTFSGWPLPRTVHWYKNNEAISNGTDDVYYSVRREGEKLHTTLRLPKGREEHQGFYKCSAVNGIPGWSSRKSTEIEMRYKCPPIKAPSISSSEIFVSIFSNVSLSCMVDYTKYCPEKLFWYKNKSSTALPENGVKYRAEYKDISSLCKKEFVLSIFNVTEDDEGRYTCSWVCENHDTTVLETDMYLVVAVQPSEVSTTTAKINPSNQPDTALASAAGNPRDWRVPVIILSAGGVTVFLVLFVWFIVKKRNKSSYRVEKQCLTNTDFINQLFVSYSSKDFVWVTEYVIPILEKHSISYSIHNRDFEIGKPIVQNMADNVYSSRQVLIVLSDNYLASNFCREELHMALQRGVETGDSSLVLVRINNLKTKKLPAALRKKRLLDFDKHKKKRDWEEKILHEISDRNLAAFA